MSPPRAPRLAVCVVLLSRVALGCATATPPETQAATTGSMHQTPEALDLLTLLGPDATGVLRVDVRSALSHGWVRAILEDLILTRSEGAAAFMQGLEHTDELVVGFWDIPEGQGTPPMLLMARGDFRSLPIEEPLQGHAVAHYRQHELRAEDTARVTVRLADHTVMNGERERVLAALDIVDGLAPASEPLGALIRGAIDRVGLREHTLAFAIAARVLMRPDGTPFSDSPQVLGFAADLGESVLVDGFVTFSDASAPDVFLAVIDNGVQLLRVSPEVEALGLVPVLERIELRTEGNELLGHALFPPDDVQRVSRALGRVLDSPSP